MDIFKQLVVKIIEEQEEIIGPIALEQARKVKGLSIDWQKKEIQIEGNETEVIDKLVEQCAELFGQASIEACKEAVTGIISQVPADKIPHLLR